jgi:hypothetical protein
MAGDWVEKSALVKFAGLALGIMIGGPLGPVVFTPLGLGIPAASTVGAFIGAILGYVATWALVALERRRRDRELENAANPVRRSKSAETIRSRSVCPSHKGRSRRCDNTAKSRTGSVYRARHQRNDEQNKRETSRRPGNGISTKSAARLGRALEAR